MFNPEHLIPEQKIESEEKKSKLKESMNSPLWRKIRKGAVYSWMVMSALGLGEMARSGISFNKEVRALTASQPEDPLEREKYSANIKIIEAKLGPEAVTDIAKRHIVEPMLNDTDTNVKIKNFDNIDIEEETLERLWEDGITYPKGWIDGEVSEITMNEIKLLDKKEVGAFVHAWKHGRKKIIIMNHNFSNSREDLTIIDGYFSHELGHANDWENKKNVVFQKRVALLADILRQIENTDIENLYSGYDLYDINDETQKNMLEAQETWAVMCKLYFCHSELFKELYPDAFKIVDDWVKNTDQNFEPLDASYKRQEIIRKHGQ